MNMQKRKDKAKSPAPSKNGASPEEQPRIAWHKLSVLKSLEIAESEAVFEESQRLSVVIDSGHATAEHVERWLELSSLVNRKELLQRRAKIFSEYVEFVPRSWFSDDAPETIDYRDPQTYLMMLPTKFAQLFMMLNMGEDQASAATGN